MNQGERDFRLIMAGQQLRSYYLPFKEVMEGEEIARAYPPHFLKSMDSYLRHQSKLADTNLNELRETVGRVRLAAACN